MNKLSKKNEDKIIRNAIKWAHNPFSSLPNDSDLIFISKYLGIEIPGFFFTDNFFADALLNPVKYKKHSDVLNQTFNKMQDKLKILDIKND